MVYQYQEQTNTQTNTNATRKAFKDFFKSQEVKEKLDKVRLNKEYVKMEDMYDRPIILFTFEDVREESQFNGQIEDFTRLYFEFADDEEHIRHSCRTQSKGLIQPLHAVGKEALESENGVFTMVCMRKEGAKTILWFEGIDN